MKRLHGSVPVKVPAPLVTVTGPRDVIAPAGSTAYRLIALTVAGRFDRLTFTFEPVASRKIVAVPVPVIVTGSRVTIVSLPIGYSTTVNVPSGCCEIGRASCRERGSLEVDDW